MHDRKGVTNPLEFPTAWVVQARKSTFDTDINGQGPSINLAVKVENYPELISLLADLGQYCNVLAFSGEPLSVTDRAVHL